MSSLMYKQALKTAEEKFLLYQMAATEWREVAEDRLYIIMALGKSMGVALDAINESDFHVGCVIPDRAPNDSFHHPDEPARIIDGACANMEALVRFSVALDRAARSSIQEIEHTLTTLNSTDPVERPHDQGSRNPAINRAAELALEITRPSPAKEQSLAVAADMSSGQGGGFKRRSMIPPKLISGSSIPSL